MERYDRQLLLPQIGAAGQNRLAGARVAIVGCGALGSTVADLLSRAGVGSLRVIDRDLVDWTNLQRQTLFDEADAREGTPKALAAERRLLAINSQVRVEGVSRELSAANIDELLQDVDLLIDGTDNAPTRYLLNDFAIQNSITWVYGACVGTEGRVMPVLPARGPCLRCVFPDPPQPGELPTCDSAGVLGPAAAIIASMQAVLAIRLLVDPSALSPELVSIDAWNGRRTSIDLRAARRRDCPCCGARDFAFLRVSGSRDAVVCGADAVQIWLSDGQRPLSLADIGRQLQPAGAVQVFDRFVRCELKSAALRATVFDDGRAIVQGTRDLQRARAAIGRYLGI